MIKSIKFESLLNKKLSFVYEIFTLVLLLKFPFEKKVNIPSEGFPFIPIVRYLFGKTPSELENLKSDLN